MKTKQISLAVPAKFSWMAVQPWGSTNLFTHEPRIHINEAWEGPEGKPGYWEQTEGEAMEIDTKTGNFSGWKESLRKIL